MSASGKCEFLHPKNALAQHVTQRPGSDLQALYAEAEEMVEAVRSDTVSVLVQEAAAMRAIAEAPAEAGRLTDDEVRRIAGAAANLRDLAGSFGYPLVSSVAQSLTVLISDRGAANPRLLAILRLHAEAIDVMLSDGAGGDGEATGAAILASLREAVDLFGGDR